MTLEAANSCAKRQRATGAELGLPSCKASHTWCLRAASESDSEHALRQVAGQQRRVQVRLCN